MVPFFLFVIRYFNLGSGLGFINEGIILEADYISF